MTERPERNVDERAGAEPAEVRAAPKRTLADLAGFTAAVLVIVLLGGAVVFQLTSQARVAQEAAALNLVAFDQAWSLIGEEHFDTDLGGVDWPAVRDELRPQMAATRSRAQGREVLSEMLSRLGQSHFALIAAEAMSTENYRREAGATGLDLRIVDGAALVTSIEEDSPAAAAGIGKGWELLQVDTQDVRKRIEQLVGALPASSRRAMQVTDAIRRLLTGPPGTSRQLTLEDGDGVERSMTLLIASPAGVVAQAGGVPAASAQIEVERLEHDIAYVAFNGFVYPALVMRTFNEAMVDALDARGLVIDLRGNGGGMLEMVTGMLGWLIAEPASIGSMVLRNSSVAVEIRPRSQSYAGPVAVLIDELCLSGSELFAHGVRSLGRGHLVGARTSGGVQGGRIERLPTGDALLFAISDFLTPEGETLEGVGVTPDLEVAPTRPALLRGDDPALAAAVSWVLGQPAPQAAGCRQQREILTAPIELGSAELDSVELANAAAEVLDHYVAVTGGAEAYAALETRTTRALLRIGGEEGLPLETTTHQARPARSLTLIASDYMGDASIGTANGQAWQSDLFNGLRWLEGHERALLMRQQRLDGPARWREGVRRLEYLSLERLDERPHHRLRLEHRTGSPEEHWYDVETGHLTRVVADLPGPLGTAKARIDLSDYRWADGILLPHLSSLRVLGVERLTTVESVEHNLPLAEDLFQVPAGLRRSVCPE